MKFRHAISAGIILFASGIAAPAASAGRQPNILHLRDERVEVRRLQEGVAEGMQPVRPVIVGVEVEDVRLVPALAAGAAIPLANRRTPAEMAWWNFIGKREAT